MEFSAAELAARLERARHGMAAARMDCLLISGIENFCYFSGVPMFLYQHRRPWCALIPLDREPVVLHLKGMEATHRGQGFLTNVETYQFPVSVGLVHKVVEVLKRIGARVVGCELGVEQRLGIPLNDFDAIRAELPDVRFVDATTVLWGLRMVKSPEEADRMRKACAITSSARQALFREVRPGMTEADVAHRFADLMHEAGSERPSFIYVMTPGPYELLPNPKKHLRAGDTLWVDGGAYVGGYTCDFSRVAVLGKASARQRELHQHASEVMTSVLSAIRPGVHVGELYEIYAREKTKRGYAAGHGAAGHGMGMLINEPPLISPSDDTVLAEGLVTGIEYGPMEPEGMFVLEEVLQIKEGGYELLSNEPWDLVEIDC